VTAATGFIVSFGVVFFLAMLQPSSSSTSLFSVVPVAILGAEGGSGVLVLSLGSSTLGVDGFVAVLAMCHILGVCFCVA